MIFRITDYVHYGTLDNRERGTVRLTLQLMGMPHPVNITLQGDCLQDLAGCVVDFRAYLMALREPDAMISVVSMVRRGSVVVSFACGALLFRERNLRAKAVDLILILVGMVFLWLGSR